MFAHWYDEDADLEARKSLLNYYHSACTTHGGYLLTLAVILFAFMNAYPLIRPFIYHSNHWLNSSSLVVLSSVLGLFISLTVHIFGRTVFWGTMASVILYVSPLSSYETNRRHANAGTANLLTALDEACIETLMKNHSCIAKFSTSKPRYLLVSWAVFTVLTHLTILSLRPLFGL